MNKPAVEKIICGYRSLFYIENTLRELIIEELSERFGQQWYKSRLPADALESYKSGLNYERKHSWRGFISFHPIYYIDFPLLRATIIRKNNWNEVFSSIFENKEHISAELSSIEPIRNAIAHNRIIGDSDLLKIESVQEYLINSIGKDRAASLSTKITRVEAIDHKIDYLRSELQRTESILGECKKINNIDKIYDILSEWWFDDDYLGFDLLHTKEYIELLRWYNELKREIGDGYKIDKMLEQRQYIQVFNKCIHDLKTMASPDFSPHQILGGLYY